MNETLSERTTRVIKDAGISPRILSKITKIHYTTIYAIMRDSEAEKAANPLTIETLNNVLTALELLVLKNQLPFEPSTTHDYRAEKLEVLLDTK